MNADPVSAGVTADRLLFAARRWGMMLVASAAVGAISAFLISQLVAPQYRATAELFLAPASNPTSSLQDIGLGQSLARTYVQLATTDVVLEPAIESVGWAGTTAQFRQRAQIAQLRDTSIITVSFRDTDPVFAASAATAIADSFITQTKDLQASLQGSAVSQLEEQIATVQSDIYSLDRDIAQFRAEAAQSPRPGQTLRPDLATQLQQADNLRLTKQQALAQLLKTRDDMRLAAARAETTVSLWQEAAVPTERESPRVTLNTALGGVAGVLSVLLLILLISFVQDRVEDSDQIRTKLGLTPLGQIQLSANPQSIQGKLFVRDSANKPEAEAFRALRTSLMFADVDRKPRSLIVTSSHASEGKSVIAANLALAFAETGTRTILIDADLRRPSQHRLFRVAATAGLTSMLTGSIDSADIRRFQVSPTLAVIPSGPLPPNPAELLASERMFSLLRQLTSLEDTVVVVDTSPALAVADPAALAPRVDGCIFVIDSSRTRASAARHAIQTLRRVNARVLGGVLNKVASERGAYYSYYSYGYSTHAGAGTQSPNRP